MIVMRGCKSVTLITLLTVAAALTYCEFLIYYQTLYSCHYPDGHGGEGSQHDKADDKALKAMFVADTHLLGSRNGHWLDKLKREWQMHRAFQTALTYFRPEVVFFLGDLMDEGKWSSPDEFQATVDRFQRLFSVQGSPINDQGEVTKVGIVAGNHDIGFHYAASPYLEERFRMAFDTESSVRVVTLKGVNFVLINSVAFEGDGCGLCREAEAILAKVGKKVGCNSTIENDQDDCKQPILLSHYPLYRKSDADCTEVDAAPEKEKLVEFRPRWDCISKESTQLIINTVNPRLAFTGHTHHGCITHHAESNLTEWTVASFSWRNKKNPSFLLATFTPTSHQVTKCFMPEEGNVYNIYILFACIPVISFFKIRR